LGEPIEPLSEALAVGGTDLASVYFAAVDLYVVEGDLLTMHVETTYNVHFRGLLKLRPVDTTRVWSHHSRV
jgi:hypothetical protein